MNNFEEYLTNYLKKYPDSIIKESMLYSNDGGNRFRPKVIFAILNGFGLDESIGYPAATALEMIQTYSLIHDDLPAMDNDDYRRGKLSSHKKFGEDMAILTGDALLTHSFSAISDSDYNNDLKVKLISILAKYAGLYGMIKGQVLDLTSNKNINHEQLIELQDNKTSGLFKVACLMAMYIAKYDKYEYFEELGSKIGIVFQNQDDLFEITKTQAETGKSKSDVDNEKITALSFMNVDELSKYINDLYDELDNYLDQDIFNAEYLKELLNKLKNR